MVNEFEIKKQLCDIGKRIYNRNMVAANDGNFSVKIAENEYLCTPTGVSKGFMTPEFICKVDGKGNVTIKAPGTVKITITAKASSDYKTAAKILTVKIAKKNATIKTKTSAKTIKCATLKKNAQVFTLGASVDSKGTLTYKKLSGSSAITVSSKTGKFTVKKGLKKGTYKVKVQIKSAAKGNYNAGSRTVTVTVTVK